MSSMNNFMAAYQAVHSPEAKQVFYKSRDQITEINLSVLFDTDLVDITEQVVAKLFETLTVSETKALVEKAFADTPSVQAQKVSRILESFKVVFNKVDETAATVARESFIQFLDRKRLERNKAVMNSIDESHARIHRHQVAGEIQNVKNLLLTMLEKKLDAVGKEDADIDNDGDVDSSDKYLHKRRKAIGKAMGKKDKKEDVKEARNPGESPMAYKKRMEKKYKGSKISKDYDPMKDPNFDHDKAERTRGSMEEGHGMHRDAKTGEVVDKAEVGKTYYPNMPKKKTSVTKKPDAFGGRFSKEEIDRINKIVESWEE